MWNYLIVFQNPGYSCGDNLTWVHWRSSANSITSSTFESQPSMKVAELPLRQVVALTAVAPSERHVPTNSDAKRQEELSLEALSWRKISQRVPNLFLVQFFWRGYLNWVKMYKRYRCLVQLFCVSRPLKSINAKLLFLQRVGPHQGSTSAAERDTSLAWTPESSNRSILQKFSEMSSSNHF